MQKDITCTIYTALFFCYCLKFDNSASKKKKKLLCFLFNMYLTFVYITSKTQIITTTKTKYGKK